MPALAGIWCCNGDNGLLDKINDFDQRPFLSNIGENLIVSSYQNLSIKSADLESAVDELTSNPTLENLENTRSTLKTARLAWQKCSPYQFGPAETAGLSASLNIYPIDVNQVESNIASGSYDLGISTNLDAQGFQAIGYLLYGNGITQDSLLTRLALVGYTDYLSDLATKIRQVSEQVYSDWAPATGNYLATFTSEERLGVDAGSTLAQLINAFSQDFERNVRDGKIGIPVGIRSLGVPVPEASEAFFSQNSIELLEASIQAYEDLYTGLGSTGFDDYLEEIGATATGNVNLASSISNQFDAIEGAIDAISGPLPQAIESNKSGVENVFVEMQRLAVLFKTNLSSALGVAITYQDSDGD